MTESNSTQGMIERLSERIEAMVTERAMVLAEQMIEKAMAAAPSPAGFNGHGIRVTEYKSSIPSIPSPAPIPPKKPSAASKAKASATKSLPAAASSTRAAIVKHLQATPDVEWTATGLAEVLLRQGLLEGASHPRDSVGHHLRAMRQAGQVRRISGGGRGRAARYVWQSGGGKQSGVWRNGKGGWEAERPEAGVRAGVGGGEGSGGECPDDAGEGAAAVCGGVVHGESVALVVGSGDPA